MLAAPDRAPVSGSARDTASWPPAASPRRTRRGSMVWTRSPDRATTPARGRTSRSTSGANGSASSAPARRPSSRFRSSPGRPSTSTSSSARRTTRCPRTTVPLDPAEQAEIKKHYPEIRARAKKTRNGVDHSPNPAAAVETAEDERLAEFESRWATGGLGFLGAFSDPARRPRGERDGGGVRPLEDPPQGEGPGGGPPPHAAVHVRLQAAVRRHRLLRDLQPPERHPGRRERLADRADRPGGARRRRRRLRVRHPGPRHRLRRDDRRARPDRHTRPGRPRAEGEVAGRAAHVPGPGLGRLPEPVRDHRDPAALRC